MALMASAPEKPVVLSTRIAPKVQFGLRLLARVQGGTISESIEWAINLAMRTTRIGPNFGDLRLAGVVDLVWRKPTEPQQIAVLNRMAPELLDFDQRAAWNLVLRCPDLWEKTYYTIEFDADGPGVEVEISSDDPRAHEDRTETVPRFDLIEKHWDAIRELGVELGRAGEIEQRYTLEEILSGEARKRAGLSSE